VSERRQFRDLIDAAEAQRLIDALPIEPARAHPVPLENAVGRVLAAAQTAPIDVPGFDRAAMDGYAVRAADTFAASETDPVSLRLTGAIHAGEPATQTVSAGSCVEISTGAVMPAGADAVVIVERTERSDDEVAVYRPVAPGQNMMAAGADIAAGTPALRAGTIIAPRVVGLLAAMGVDEVLVRDRPQVGIISTGDELVRPGETLTPTAGQIYDVNSYTVAAAVEEAGGVPVLYPHAGDTYTEMEAQLREAAAACDLVVSSGSTSASAVDVIYRVIEDAGELLAHGVAVKPGKPMLIGRFSDSAYIGLPGYPVSALTIFRRFVAPRLRAAAGRPPASAPTITGRMLEEGRFGEGRLRLMPVGVIADESGDPLVYPVDKGSGATTSLVEADGVVSVPATTAYVAADETVEVELFDTDWVMPRLLLAGEPDPVVTDLLAQLTAPRFLAVGSDEGRRRLRRGIVDAAVVTGEGSAVGEPGGRLTRRWGAYFSADTEQSVEEALADPDLRVVSVDDRYGLHATIREWVDDADRWQRVRTMPGLYSPVEAVRRGDAELALTTAMDTHDAVSFTPLGTAELQIRINPSRAGKQGVTRLRAAAAGSLTDTV
jgi:molybdenum cofactor synthesis domain-containing protein